MDTALTPEQRQYAEIVRVSGETLLTLINDILDFSKIEARKLILETLDFDLANCLEEIGEMLAVRAQREGAGIQLSHRPRRPHPVVWRSQPPAPDPGQPGGQRDQVHLAGGGGGPRAIGDQKMRTTATLHFSVRDTGMGIPPDRMSVLFSPFSQADSATTRHFGGTGLGLAIARQLTELMGGQIGVESAADRGFHFLVYGSFWQAAAEGQPLSRTRLPSWKACGCW